MRQDLQYSNRKKLDIYNIPLRKNQKKKNELTQKLTIVELTLGGSTL